MQFFQLLISDYRRCLGERIDRALGLREGDDIADGVEVEHQHDETIKAEGDACMRRSTVLECIKQEAEFLLCFFLRDTDGFKYFFLQILLVDTKGAAAGFDTVQDHIIGFRIDLGRIGEEVLYIFISWCGEWMMFSDVAFFFFTVFEHREVGDPAEAEFIRVDEAHAASHFETEFAKSLCDDLRLVRNDEDEVAFFRFADFADLTDLVFTEEFGDLALQAAVFIEADPSQTFGTIVADVFDEAVEFTTRNAGIAFDGDGFHTAAIIEDGAKYFEAGVTEQVGYIIEMHIETKVRFVGTIESHGVIPFDPLERDLDIDIEDFLEDSLHHVFHEVQNEVLVFEGELHIQLGEFRLAIGTQVFITEAASDLEVAFQTGNHEQLFEELRGLRQSVEFARVHAGWDEVVACAFRGALGEHRGLDFEKIVFIEEGSHLMYDLMAHDEVVLHFRTAQIDVAVFQTDVFIDIDAVFDVEWGGLRFVQDAKLGNDDFHLAGLHLRVDSFFASLSDLAFDSEDEFTAAGFRLVECFFPVLWAHDELYNTASVAKVDENETAMVTTGIHPACQCQFFAAVIFCYQTASAGSMHPCHCFHIRAPLYKNVDAVRDRKEIPSAKINDMLACLLVCIDG